MNPFLFSVLVLILLFFLDFLTIFFKLGMKGTFRGIKFIFGEGYREEAFSVEGSSSTNVLIVGDSTVFGPGAELHETLAARLGNKYDINIANLSNNGSTTWEIIGQLNCVQDKKFDLVMVFAGNNDIWKLTNLKELTIDASLLLDKAKTLGGKVLVFRGGNIGNCPFFPIFFSYLYTYRSRRVRSIFMQAAQERSILYVEKWMERKDDVFLKDSRKFYCWDLLHLSGEGFRLWFDYLEEKMREGGILLPLKNSRL